MRVRCGIALVGIAVQVARAEPVETRPPAPLNIPELTPQTRVGVSATTIAHSGLAILTGLGGSYAVGSFEIVGSIPAIAFGDICFEGCMSGTQSELGLGNMQLGMRFIGDLGPIAVSGAVWGWLPTQTVSDRWWPRSRMIMTGATDSRAFLPDPALGAAVDVAWRTRTSFVQAELGTALVADGGPQVDNVVAALGAGTKVSTRLALLGEWRVDAYPRQPWIHSVGLGVARDAGGGRRWRVRLHVVNAGVSETSSERSSAVQIAFDYSWQLP